MKGLIVYKGKYGATRQYAEWLSAELNLPVVVSDEVTNTQINRSEFLLIGTSVYFGKFKIRNWLKKNAKEIRNKKLFLFIVNATAPEEEEKRDKFVQDNVSAEIKQQCQIFFLPGRVIHKDLNWTDKLILQLAGSFIKDPRKKDAMRADLDGVKKENLLPLTKAVNNFFSGKKAGADLRIT